MGHRPRIAVWIAWEKPVIYFITICVVGRKPVLANEAAFSAFKKAVAKLRNWKVLAAVLMPDHLHVIVAPEDREAKVGEFLRRVEALDSRGAIRVMGMAAWVF